MASRAEAVRAILDDLAEFTIDLNAYYDDIEATAVINTAFFGKTDSLRAYCRLLGWSELSTQLAELPENAVHSLELVQSYVIHEARRLLATTDVEGAPSPIRWFWDLLHPRVCALAKPRFEAGFFGDAVEASFKEVNDVVKRLVKDANGLELDGAALMNKAFSPQTPIVRLTQLSTKSDENVQQGYMLIMAGAMTGIRNPNAHANLGLESAEALHLVCLASLLLRKLDERQ